MTHQQHHIRVLHCGLMDAAVVMHSSWLSACVCRVSGTRAALRTCVRSRCSMPKGGSSTREYRIWDKEEEDALRDGVKKHGLGAWERIRTDPAYSVLL